MGRNKRKGVQRRNRMCHAASVFKFGGVGLGLFDFCDFFAIVFANFIFAKGMQQHAAEKQVRLLTPGAMQQHEAAFFHTLRWELIIHANI